MGDQKSLSMADRVFQTIEEKIVDGTYEPGAILTELKLCAEMDVSRTPVREALNRLEHDNMIEETGKGNKIIGISEKDIITMYRLREMIDGLCAVDAAKNITDDELKQLSDILDYADFCKYFEVGSFRIATFCRWSLRDGSRSWVRRTRRRLR